MSKKKKARRNRIIILSLVGVIALLVIYVAFFKKKERGISIQVDKVSKGAITATVSATGMVEPENEVKIAPDVSGEIIELYVEEGDSVKQDQLLLRIRPDNLISILDRNEANLNQQRANLADARAREARALATYEQSKRIYERNKQLHEENVISDAEFEQIEADYRVANQDLESARKSVDAASFIVESAKASVREAQENVDLTNVFAPVSGIISKLSVEKGERVVGTQTMAGTEMLRIADLNRMQVTVDVNENDVIRVQEGDTALIEVDAYEAMDVSFKGVVFQIASTANEKASADAITEFQVEVRMLNESYREFMEEQEIAIPFRPGMTASVEIITDKKSDIVMVPIGAVTTRMVKAESTKNAKQSKKDANEAGSNNKMQEVVFVYKPDNTVEQRPVKTGISDLDHIQILEGLEPDDQIVTGPFIAVSKFLEDGKLVKIDDSGGQRPDDWQAQNE